MDFRDVPSLEYLAGVKIGLAIISNPGVAELAFASDYYYPCISKEVFDLFNENISTLILPKECSDRIRIITMNMLKESIMWQKFHWSFMSGSQMSVTNLCWTPYGSIDERKTARKLVNRIDLNTRSRFWLACGYCLFYEASTIWEAMSLEEKLSSNNGTALGLWIHIQCTSGIGLTSYMMETKPWTYDSNEELLFSFITYLVERIEKCNIHSFRFVLKRSTPADRTRLLRRVALSNGTSRYLRRFCFQQLDKVAQLEVLEKFPLEVLRYFYEWPFQNRPFYLVDRIWNLITPKDFCDFIVVILIKMNGFFWQNFELFKILRYFWHQSPVNFKDHTNQSAFAEILKLLFDCNCFESFKSDAFKEAITNALHLNLARRFAMSFE